MVIPSIIFSGMRVFLALFFFFVSLLPQSLKASPLQKAVSYGYYNIKGNGGEPPKLSQIDNFQGQVFCEIPWGDWLDIILSGDITKIRVIVLYITEALQGMGYDVTPWDVAQIILRILRYLGLSLPPGQ